MTGLCADCAAGALHGGTPSGTVTVMFGLPTYVAEPPGGEEAQAVIVILADAFGWELVNSRILADSYAEKSKCRVLLPDFFLGNWLPHDLTYSIDTVVYAKQSVLSKIPSGLRTSFYFFPFLFYNRWSVTKPRIYDFFRALRASTSLSVGAAGFCWGGKWVTLMAHGQDRTEDGRPLIDAAYTAHPSMLKLPDDAEPVQLPYSVAIGTLDHAIGPAQLSVFKKALEGKKDVEVIEYEGARHGFAVRGNPEIEAEKKNGIAAEDQAVRWLCKYLIKSAT